MANKPGHRDFGYLRKLRSGRIHASYIGPDGERHNAPTTYQDLDAARIWLRKEKRLVEDGEWIAPEARKAAARQRGLTFAEYAATWLANRKVKGRPLAGRTRDGYEDLLDRYINPTFGDVELTAITDAAVDAWYEATAVGMPTTKAHAYGLLRTVLNTAVERRLIPFNPCKVPGRRQYTPPPRRRPGDASGVGGYRGEHPGPASAHHSVGSLVRPAVRRDRGAAAQRHRRWQKGHQGPPRRRSRQNA